MEWRDNVLAGNIVGLGFDGLTGQTNVADGISVAGGQGNTIQQNVVSGHRGTGILLTTTDQNVVTGNPCGPGRQRHDRAGQQRGRRPGRRRTATVGGSASGAGNVVSGTRARICSNRGGDSRAV